MQTTQLTCPHCGSMINFGGIVAPGTPVTCLICMQAFAAAPIAVAKVAAAAPKPLAGILVSKPHAAAKPERTPPTRQGMTPVKQEAPSSGKAALWAVTLSLLVLLTAGTGFAIWKLNHAGGPSYEQPIAMNQKSGPEPKVGVDPVPPKPAEPKDGGSVKVPPPIGGSNDDDDPRRKKEAEKNVLKRKPSTDPGGKGPEFDPITTIEIPAPTVPGVEPARINTAVDKGVAYLKQSQAGNGMWNVSGFFPLGATALGGLTLLECKVPAKDPAVQKAVAVVRTGASGNSTTYEISLALLFLDRLGEARDRTLIQALALRLLNGQRECGGWSYECPGLTDKDLEQLFAYLRSHQPPAKKKIDPKAPPAVDKQEDPGVKLKPMRPEALALPLRTLPVVRNQGLTKGNLQYRPPTGGTDNSNTQFALLALWAARRHEVNTDAALLTAYERFVKSQARDSGWEYQPVENPRDGNTTNTMTCVGLLGLAMGHGVAPDIVKLDPNDPKGTVTKPALQDPKIEAGLKALGKFIGDTAPDKDNVGGFENMYFLWSVERVAMLYDLNRIDGKDWYGYGAQKLLKHQGNMGEWASAAYPGNSPHSNTCFALLFLKRSNLVQDLTLHLRLATTVRDSEK